MRFGLDDGSETHARTPSFAVTRERIRQIEAKALRKLRHPSRSRKLRAFLEGSFARLPLIQDWVKRKVNVRMESCSCSEPD